jgi:pimeloyl-ACP methyl ester carboxylesterase
MHKLPIRIFAAFLLAVLTSIAVADGKFIELKTRPGVTQGIYLIKPPSPVASVVLLPGGSGVIQLGPDGPERDTNFLVRSRDLFAENKLMVAVVDAASDFSAREDGLAGKRTSKEHVQDLNAVVNYLRKETNVPVWLIGTSRGTISAAAFASQMPDSANGIVLTSSVSESAKKRSATVLSSDLSKITVPVLLAHHKADDCSASPFSAVTKIQKKLVNSKKVGTLSFDGGTAKQKNGCKPKTYHGFFKIEDDVVVKISDWIKSN